MFEFASYNLSSAWSGHVNFAYDLVRFMQPKRIVELGTHYGVSLFSFCQGIKDGNLQSNCFGIDSWVGDPHSGSYGEDVFQTVKTISDIHYPNIPSLVRTTFDDAVHLFEDRTINLLHIDGYHTFEAVSHDFETWLPKVAENGVILFHDIALRGWRDFGVYKLWETLKIQYPAIEFHHSAGLGVLFPKGVSDNFQEVLQKEGEFQNHYNS